MENLRVSINKIFKGAMHSFARFPASIISAIIISIVAIIKISMGWETQKTYSLLFDSIQLAFLLGASFSMGAVAYEEVESENKKISPIFSNISGLVIGIITFLILYFSSGTISDEGIRYVSSIASIRVGVGVFISIIGFIYIMSNAKAVDSFSDAFFIIHKAFFISAIYGLVIMIGVSGVLGAFQALVYRGLSFKVYQYLGVVVGFLIYTIFLGYFPSLRSTEKTSKMRAVEEQPRVVFVLFGYILVPIIIALTVVLLIWTARVAFSGVDVSFTQLSSIASSYVIIGIWLHIMVSKHNTKISKFYKTAYPFSAILVLAFEAWALVVQVDKFGMKTMEYSFIMIWVFALISVILLIFLKDRAYRNIAIAAALISIISVLPFIGYQDISFNSQVARLDRLLNEENLLVNNNIVKSDDKIEVRTRSEITDAVDFITYSEKTNTPLWFKDNLDDYKVFKDTFGFDKAYGLYEGEMDYTSMNLTLKTELIDISDYPMALNININEKMDLTSSFQGKDGDYELIWTTKPNGIPEITVNLNDKLIIEESLETYLKDLQLKYPLEGNYMQSELSVEDMSLLVEGGGLSILLVFDNINIYYDSREDRLDYLVNIYDLYIKYD